MESDIGESSTKEFESSESSDSQYYSSDEVIELAREDMDFFGALVCPDDIDLAFPNFYHYLWKTLIEKLSLVRDFSKFALGLPRGHAKTMVVKLLVVYAILFTKKHYILIIGANQKKARSIIADVADMLDSYNIQQIFGNWSYGMEISTQDLKKFNFQGRPIILEAAGQGTSIRGTQQKNKRPDIIIFDDAQTADCAASIPEAEAFKEWFLGTALKAKSPKGCTYIYIGNMYKEIELVPGSRQYTCMLQNLKNSPNWTSFVVGCILQDGHALWEELHPLEELLEEYQQDLQMNEPEIFFSEMMNDPKAQSSIFFQAKNVLKYQPSEYELHQGNYIVVDPATSKLTPDQMVIGYFELYDGVPNITEIHQGKWTAPESVHFIIKLALSKQCSLVVIEDNAYQYTLCEWLFSILQQLGITGLVIKSLSNSGKNKNSRILEFLKALNGQQISTSPHSHAVVLDQAFKFDPRITKNLDDILDCCEMATRVSQLFAADIAVPGQLDSTNLPRAGGNLTDNPPPLPF